MRQIRGDMVATCPFWIYGCLVIALPFPVGVWQCYPIEQQLIVVNCRGGLRGWRRVRGSQGRRQLVAFTGGLDAGCG